jgi:hypothetical protein
MSKRHLQGKSANTCSRFIHTLFIADVHSYVQLFLYAHERSALVRCVPRAKLVVREIAFDNPLTTKKGVWNNYEQLAGCERLQIRLRARTNYILASLSRCVELTLLGNTCYYEQSNINGLPKNLKSLAVENGLLWELYENPKLWSTVTHVTLRLNFEAAFDFLIFDNFPMLEHLELANVEWCGDVPEFRVDRQVKIFERWESRKIKVQFHEGENLHVFDWNGTNRSKNCIAFGNHMQQVKLLGRK